MNIEIIKCDMSLHQKLTDFYFRVTAYLDSHINFPKWTHGVYPGHESIKSAIEDGGQYACISDGEIIGAFVLNDDPQGAYEKGDWEKPLEPGEFLVIHALAVRTDDYGKGIATKMVEYCIEKARDEGYKGIRLDVVPENYPARKLYEKAGFRFAGEKDLDRGYENIPTFQLFELNF